MQADLDTLRARLGAKTNTDDGILAGDLEAATAWVYDRIYDSHRTLPEVQESIVLLASRLYKRRQSPDGLAGWSADGVVARIGTSDPDIKALLARHIDMCQAGVA